MDTIVAKSPFVQYKTQEFLRLLANIESERNKSYHCQESTYEVISKLLSVDYEHKESDIDYLMDAVNAGLIFRQCKNKKSFPVSKYLDWAIQNELYIHQKAVI